MKRYYSQFPAVVILILDPNLKGLWIFASLLSLLFGSTGLGFLTSTTLTITPPFSISPDHILNLTFSKPGTLGSNLELKLEKLSKRPSVIKSLKIMEQDIAANRHKVKPGLNPMSYQHNKLISELFREAKVKAWARMKANPNVIRLIEAARQQQIADNLRTEDPEKSRSAYDEATELLNMVNR